MLGAHDQMQVAGLAADRAVAVGDMQDLGGPHLEADAAAMAAATMRDQGFFGHDRRLRRAL